MKYILKYIIARLGYRTVLFLIALASTALISKQSNAQTLQSDFQPIELVNTVRNTNGNGIDTTVVLQGLDFNGNPIYSSQPLSVNNTNLKSIVNTELTTPYANAIGGSLTGSGFIPLNNGSYGTASGSSTFPSGATSYTCYKAPNFADVPLDQCYTEYGYDISGNNPQPWLTGYSNPPPGCHQWQLRLTNFVFVGEWRVCYPVGTELGFDPNELAYPTFPTELVITSQQVTDALAPPFNLGNSTVPTPASSTPLTNQEWNSLFIDNLTNSYTDPVIQNIATTTTTNYNTNNSSVATTINRPSNVTGIGTGIGGSGSGASTSGSGSSSGSGPCDPSAIDYSSCIGFTEQIGDSLLQSSLDGQLNEGTGSIDDYGEAFEDSLDGTQEDGITNFDTSGIDDIVTGFFPNAPVTCNSSTLQMTIKGESISVDCNVFVTVREFGAWFMYVITAFAIFNIFITSSRN